MAGTNKKAPANEVEALQLAKEKEKDRHDEKSARSNSFVQSLARDQEIRLRAIECSAQRAQALTQLVGVTEKLFTIWMLTSLPPEGRQLAAQIFSAPPAPAPAPPAPLAGAFAHSSPPSLASLMPHVVIPTPVHPHSSSN